MFPFQVYRLLREQPITSSIIQLILRQQPQVHPRLVQVLFISVVHPQNNLRNNVFVNTFRLALLEVLQPAIRYVWPTSNQFPGSQ